MANEFDNLDLPAFTDCEIRSLKVLDAEIDRINNHYNNLIEQSKKEREIGKFKIVEVLENIRI